MKGFSLTNGDLTITNNEIDMIEGNNLTAQTIRCVLSTNKGEWFFDAGEGIDFDNIFGKNRIKPKSTSSALYQKEYMSLKEDENELAEKLGKRLDGE